MKTANTITVHTAISVIERFLIDARDDFFQDPFDYADLRNAKNEISNALVHDYNALLDDPRKYAPKDFFHWDVPKKNFVVRQAIMLHPHDRLIHHCLLSSLVYPIHQKTSDNCYSYKVSDPSAKWLFGPKPVSAWINFKTSIINEINSSSPKTVLVSTDIAGFYEYISVRDYKKQLQNIVEDSFNNVLELLAVFLKRLAYSGENGIPQNYDPSSFLTSAFLDYFDKEIEALGYKHFRYVDDIKLIAKNIDDAKLAIIKIIHILRKKNLNLQTAKTEIWNKDSKGYKDFSADFPELLTTIDKEIDRKRKENIDKLLPELIELTNKVMNEKTFNDQLFRACIWRIVKCHYFKNIKKYSLNKITLKCLRLLDEMPGKSDSFIDFLVLEKDKKTVQQKLFDITKRSVYDWQKVQIWNLLTKVKALKIKDILKYAQFEIRNVRKHDPTVNSIILFLGRFGDYNDKEFLAQMYSEPHSYFTKRCLLIAIQEYQDRNIVYNMVESSSDDVYLKPLTKYLRSLKKPRYINENTKIGSDLAFIS